MAYTMNRAFRFAPALAQQQAMIGGMQPPALPNQPFVPGELMNAGPAPDANAPMSFNSGTPHSLMMEQDRQNIYRNNGQAAPIGAPPARRAAPPPAMAGGNVQTRAPNIGAGFTPQTLMDDMHRFPQSMGDTGRLTAAYNANVASFNDPRTRGAAQDAADINGRIAQSHDITAHPENYLAPGRVGGASGNVAGIDGGGGFRQVGTRSGGGYGINGLVGSQFNAPQALTQSEAQFGRAGEDAAGHAQRLADIQEAGRHGMNYVQLTQLRQQHAEQLAAQQHQDQLAAQAREDARYKIDAGSRVQEIRNLGNQAVEQGRSQTQLETARIAHTPDPSQVKLNEAKAAATTQPAPQSPEQIDALKARAEHDRMIGQAAITDANRPRETRPAPGTKPAFGGVPKTQQDQERERWKLSAKQQYEGFDRPKNGPMWDQLKPEERAKLANEFATREGHYVF